MSDGGAGPTHVAFLRAINVGGRRLTMDELQAAVAPLGFTAVATWQATGNVAFATEADADPGALEDRIATTLAAGLGIAVPTVVRTAAQVRALATDVPFSEEQLAATEGRVQLLLVRDEPAPEVRARVLATHATAVDELHWGPRELWWLPRRGVSDSRLRVSAVERVVGVATMRSHRAVAGLAAKLL